MLEKDDKLEVDSAAAELEVLVKLLELTGTTTLATDELATTGAAIELELRELAEEEMPTLEIAKLDELLTAELRLFC